MVDGNLFPDYPTADTVCPHCENKIEACTNMQAAGGGPKPGDLTLCAYCAAALIFTDGLGVRPATPDDLADLDDESRASLVKAAVVSAEFRKRKR